MSVLNTIFMPMSNVFLFELAPIDFTFFVIFFSILVVFLLILIVNFFNNKRTSKVIKKEIAKNNGGLLGDNHLAKALSKKEETTTVEEVKVEETVEPVVEEKVETVEETIEPVVEETVEVVEEVETEEQPEVVEEVQVEEQPVVVEEQVEVVEETVEPVVEEQPEVVEEQVEPVVEEQPEVVEEQVEPTVEETVEPVVEEQPEEETTEEVKHGREYNGKYEVYKDNDFYRYRLKASNGEVLLVSEIYSTYKSCLTSIEALKRNLEKGKAVIIVDKRKNYKFKIVAANHRVIAISANYVSEARAQSALASFQRFAVTNDIVEVELPAEELDSTLVLIDKVKDEDKRGGKFIIKKDKNGEFTWELKPNNGEILCQSGGYCTRSSVESSIMAFKEVVKTGKFYIYTDKNNNYQFKLYSKLGRLYMVGESYSTSAAVESVVKSILNFIDMSVIQDKTATTTAKKTTTKK